MKALDKKVYDKYLESMEFVPYLILLHVAIRKEVRLMQYEEFVPYAILMFQ